MDVKDIKSQMMKLWKDTFRDSDKYIHLIFDNYFNLDLIAYKEIDGEIISALLAVPYDFYVNNNDKRGASDLYKLRGLYLCGLATKNKYRRGGIMSDLIGEINCRAKILNYDFTFLIPANDALNYYYSRRGYVDVFKRYENNFVAGYQFMKYDNTKVKGVLIIDDVQKLANVLLYESEGGDIRFINSTSSSILEWSCTKVDRFTIKNVPEYAYEIISRSEIKNKGVTLSHSLEDVRILLEENIISGGNIFMSENSIAIINFADDRIIIPHIFYEDIYSRDQILEAISEKYPRMPITYYSYEGDKNNIRLEPKKYGMIRFLKVDEILKFAAESSCSSKFSILVKDVCEGETNFYHGENGRINRKVMSKGEVRRISELKNGGEVSELTIRELVEILSRNPESPDYALTAFALPRISFCMSYLLD